MRQLRKWISTLSLAGLALSALMFVSTLQLVPTVQAEGGETRQFTKCTSTNVPYAPHSAEKKDKKRVWVPFTADQLDEMAIAIPAGWTAVGGTTHGLVGGVVLCR